MRAVASAVPIAAVILIGAITGIALTGAPASASAAGGAYAAAYAISRDGAPLRTVGGTTTSLTDTVAAGSTHTYSVVAVDGAGNSSPPSPAVTATTPSAAPPVFADGLESGKLSAWTTTQGLTVQTQTVRTGQYAALAYVYVNASGVLGVHDDTTGANLLSTTTLSPGWHVLELHLGIDSAPATASGRLELWADDPGSPVISTVSIDTGSAPIGQIQIGDVQTARTYTVAYDDIAFGTSRLGPNP